ncbi:MAG TPA: hypothetical protein VHR45_00975 [Thermoanaerobaculia bacterium]|nr:hypothetical protein [Thermoanaerobaculia bacterium]
MRRVLALSLLVSALGVMSATAWADEPPTILWRAPDSAPVDPAANPPAAPTNLLASNLMTNQVTLSWTLNSNDATTIHVEGKTTVTGFQSTNAEILLKVLNGCGVDNEFWFFAAGLTNVRVDIHVTHTSTGAMNTYINALNNPFPPIQDTSAFMCP